MSANPDANYVLSDIAVDTSAPTETATPTEVDQLPDAAALQAQIDLLTQKLDYETQLRDKSEEQSAFWFNIANRKAESQQPDPQQFQAPPQVQPPQLNEDRYNLILSNPAEMAKYVDEVAEYKARHISREEASQIADAKAAQIQGVQNYLQNAWIGEVSRMKQAGVANFGTPGDPLTEMFAQRVRGMMADPSYRGVDPVVAMRLAISQAEADYLRQGGQAPEETQQPQAVPPNYPRTLTGQQQRNAAIAAQQPSTGRRPTPPEKYSNIPPEQLALMQKHAAGLGVPIEKIIEQMPRVVQFRKQRD